MFLLRLTVLISVMWLINDAELVLLIALSIILCLMWCLTLSIISFLILLNCKWLWCDLKTTLLWNPHIHSIKITFLNVWWNVEILSIFCCVVLWKTDLSKRMFFLVEKCSSNLFNACWYSVPVSVSGLKISCVSGPATCKSNARLWQLLVIPEAFRKYLKPFFHFVQHWAECSSDEVVGSWSCTMLLKLFWCGVDKCKRLVIV